jgi:hypothetical protein
MFCLRGPGAHTYSSLLIDWTVLRRQVRRDVKRQTLRHVTNISAILRIRSTGGCQLPYVTCMLRAMRIMTMFCRQHTQVGELQTTYEENRLNADALISA